MPSPEQRAAEMGEEGEGERSVAAREGPSGHSQADTTTNNLLASVKEQELQFERLTRELEEERQIVASQLERCMLGAESPGDDDDASSSDSSEKSFAWRSTDVSGTGEHRAAVMDSSHQSPSRLFRADQGHGSLYLPEPERASLHDSEGSVAHMTSYADSGYQDSSMSYYSVSRENVVLSEPRHVLSGSGPRGSPGHGRSSRAEGQASAQASASGRVMRRMGSLPSRGQSPVCGVGGAVSPSRVSLRTSQGGSAYGSPILTEPKPLASIFPGTTMPPSSPPGPGTTPSFQRATSPYSPTHQRNGNGDSPLRTSPRPGSASHATSPHQATGSISGCLGSTLSLVEGRGLSGSPLRSCMTAVPQHYGSTLPRQGAQTQALHYGHDAYGLYERTALPLSRPDSLTGLHSSYATHHSPLDQDMRMAMSPDCHITPVYDDRAFHSPLYHSPTHTHHGSHSAIYRTLTGAANLQRTLQRTTSHCSTLAYQRSSYGLNTAGSYADPYRVSQQGQGPNENSFSRHSGLVDRAATRSPSIDSIEKDPREFSWRDPALPEVIRMLQHHFPSVQANAAAYLQHLCYGDNRIKVEVCHLGGIQHLVDLLDHKAVEVQKSACGALRNLVYGKATDDNKVALRNSGGIPALLRLLRKTTDNEVRELVTGVLWNLSSCDAVKMTIIRDALRTLTNTVVIPHSGWSSANYREETKLKFHSSLLLRNTTGCLRNLSSAGEEARGQLRGCEGLVDSLLYVLKACVHTSDFDSKIVENCVCTLRNLSYRLEIEMPSSCLLGTQELDALLGYGSPGKDLDYLCWGKKRKKKRSWLDDKWDGVGPIPGFGKPPRGAEMLWHPAVVKPYLSLLAESSNPATLEGSAGSLQNLSAGNWKFAAYIRAAVRKEKGLPILVELLRMDNDRVVCSVATALRNMALDSRNKELIGKYAMRDLVNRLPGGSPSLLSDETVASVCCTLHEVTSRNMENAKALADTGGIEKLVDISKGRGGGYSMKVVKAAAQVLNTLWQYRDLRTLYKQDGWHHGHFITPVSTLERDRYRSQPTLPTSTLQMSPVPRQSGGSATSSPAMLGIRRPSSNYQRAQSSMQLDTYYGDNSLHKNQYTGSEKQTPYFIGSYSSPSREDYPRSQEDVFYSDDPDRNTYNNYRMYLSSPQGYGEEEPGPYQDEPVDLTSTERYNTTQSNRLKSNTNTTNYVDFYSTTRRPSQRANQYTGSPDSWV
ncbi:LOW QUALITY PROTEIN: plakophilin-4 [Coregonus clupeaformis]|uniref:LOW QUALITY PROTEIN: plakophilin-4 n=1 Tax=Coregonus clupeaformis TaxID=59861 RepID=UPI001E1C95A2|nr:LOW QUALITY PROTEIN: plakophilin-4 [Coregonus clupeaformis]